MFKNYDHKTVEEGIEKKWRDKKYFMTHHEKSKPFSILLPPPNVTGKLHLGHALDTYIPDTIIRYKKLKGFDVLWLPGMDHAGIATQSKVEDVLYKETGLTRHDLGREKFIEKIWEWKEKHELIFREQWQKIGLALDYENERFTLDAKTNKAVEKVFIDLYKKGFIYRGIRAVNWDIKLQTAVSNIEVNNEPTEQEMYYIKYKVFETGEDLIIATVRPETLLSDVAVIYNPNDKKYKKYQGMHIIHPLTKKNLPILADEYVDINFGTGLMKLSAHAEIDIEIIQKLNLEIIETIDKNGFINAPNSIFDKLERFQARKEIAKYLKDNNLIYKSEKVISNVGISDRSKSVVEILVLPQWFVKMKDFAKLILNNLKSKESVKFFPKRFANNLKIWMKNIHDWNISRQLWWGHRIPAWYKGNEIKVQSTSPGDDWTQDSDVLDTWFSSGLAPFVFMDWPNNNTKLLKRYYPTSLMVTGSDLIFFWIARMYFFGLYFTEKVPFEKVLIHGLIRDANGNKMSKSLNNGVDPMEMVEKYGSDALRWFLITNASPGLDIKFSVEKVESAWKVNNKLWNIAKYIYELPNINNSSKMFDSDKWIFNKLYLLKKKIDKLMKTYEFSVIGNEIYKYIFNDLSGWYVELIKSNSNKKFALKILEKTLIILHPFLPFITDKIYQSTFNKEILEQKWPKLMNYKDINYIDEVILITTELRKFRDENKISWKQSIGYFYQNTLSDEAFKMINRMANANIIQNNDLLISINGNNLYIQIDDELKEKNKEELTKKIKFVQSEIDRAKKILSNERFVQSAPKHKIDEERKKLEQYQKDLEKYLKEFECKY